MTFLTQCNRISIVGQRRGWSICPPPINHKHDWRVERDKAKVYNVVQFLNIQSACIVLYFVGCRYMRRTYASQVFC